MAHRIIREYLYMKPARKSVGGSGGGVGLRTFKPTELQTLLPKDAAPRQALGFGRVLHRRTLERRLAATLPEAEAQVHALGLQLLSEVELGPDEPQAPAIDGRMYQTGPARPAGSDWGLGARR